jgi:TolB protein
MMTIKQNQIIKRSTILAAAGIVCSVVVAGCISSNGNEANRKVIEKPNKTITIVDTESAAASNQTEVAKIDELKGIRGMDWLGEDKLIIDKENKGMKPLKVEGEERYPHNLYIHDLNAGEDQTEELLKGGTVDQSFAMLSPDKKYMFYKEAEETTGRGYIMDLATRKTMAAGQDQIPLQEGSWNGNEQIIFPVMSHKILSSNLQGQTSILTKTKDLYVYNVFQRGANVYYIGMNNILMLYNTVSGAMKILDKQVIWMIPSPDGKQLALVKRTSDTEMELTLTDSSLTKKVSLAKGTQVFGTSWSPDGTKLAYTVSSETGGVKGVFAADVVSGKSTQIAVDIQYASDPIKWSPSGQKIITVSAKMQDNKYVFITYIIRFK